MASLSIRIDFDQAGRLGPGKVALLEQVAETGSISAAGRAMGMSYRRAWELIADLNTIFEGPLVAAKVGGKQGGGAVLTPLGETLVRSYREIEAAAHRAAEAELSTLDAALPRQ